MVYCDNDSVVYLSSNPIQHRRTKHIEIDIQFVREKISLSQVRVLHVTSSLQFVHHDEGAPDTIIIGFLVQFVRSTPSCFNGGGGVLAYHIYFMYKLYRDILRIPILTSLV